MGVQRVDPDFLQGVGDAGIEVVGERDEQGSLGGPQAVMNEALVGAPVVEQLLPGRGIAARADGAH